MNPNPFRSPRQIALQKWKPGFPIETYVPIITYFTCLHKIVINDTLIPNLSEVLGRSRFRDGSRVSRSNLMSLKEGRILRSSVYVRNHERKNAARQHERETDTNLI